MADMGQIINDPKAREVGLGYEELTGVMMHNPDLYTEQGHAKDNELKSYIKNNLFLKNEQLRYNHILNFFTPAK